METRCARNLLQIGSSRSSKSVLGVLNNFRIATKCWTVSKFSCARYPTATACLLGRAGRTSWSTWSTPLDNILSQLMALAKAEGGRRIQECQQLCYQFRSFPKLCLCRARKHDFLSFLDKSSVPMRNWMEGWVLTSSQWAVTSLFIRHGVQLRSEHGITGVKKQKLIHLKEVNEKENWI